MGRIGAMMEGWTPLIMLGLAVLIGLTAMALRPRRSRRGGGDAALDGMSGVEEYEGEASGPAEQRDFAGVLRNYVVPQRAAHPDWDRLDGAVEVPGQPLVAFDWNGTRYAVVGDTRFAPLLAARDWMDAHPGEEPLEIAPGNRRGRLRLRSAIWPAAADVHIETR